MKQLCTRKCQIHNSAEHCVLFRLDQLKIAVAVAIIRNRPRGTNQTVKEFVINLQISLQKRDESWKMEYFRLKREVQLLRQQQILLLRSQSAGVTEAVVHRKSVECHGFLELTPPDSQLQEASIDSQDQDGQITFLRAYFFLEHQLRVQADVVEDGVIQQSVSTVLRHVDRSIRRNRVDMTRCMESLQICVRLLDVYHKWDVSILNQLFAETAARWLHSIRNEDQSGTYSALLHILADSDFASRLCPLVVKRIAQTQTSISGWQSPEELIPRKIVDDFIASSYYFTLLETLVPRLCPGDRLRHVTLFPPIDARVQLHFPLFAASVMRCLDTLNK